VFSLFPLCVISGHRFFFRVLKRSLFPPPHFFSLVPPSYVSPLFSPSELVDRGSWGPPPFFLKAPLFPLCLGACHGACWGFACFFSLGELVGSSGSPRCLSYIFGAVQSLLTGSLRDDRKAGIVPPPPGVFVCFFSCLVQKDDPLISCGGGFLPLFSFPFFHRKRIYHVERPIFRWNQLFFFSL